MKILKGFGGHPPRSSAVLEKYGKLTLVEALKNFQRFFVLSFLHLISNGLNGVNINSLN